MPGPTYDLAVIGGGLNGCAVARDAAGRGLSVFLCEQGDLGGGASSNTGRLAVDGVPGTRAGTAFLISLEAAREEAVVLKAAPHVVRPLTVVIPRRGGMRDQIRRFGLHLHGWLAPRAVGAVGLDGDRAATRLRPEFRFAQEFTTAVIDDARLVVLNALDAKTRGADIRTRTRCIDAHREGWFWKLTVESVDTGEQCKIVARALVNAAGPHAGGVLGGIVKGAAAPVLGLVKRSYAIVRGRFAGDRGFALPDGDGGIVFAIPYERDFTLIGPVEVCWNGDPAAAAVDEADIAALLAAVNAHFRVPLAPEAIAWTTCAVSMQRASGAADGDLAADMPDDLAPILSILGSRPARHRLLAEALLDRVKGVLPVGKRWTKGAPLPGGHFAVGDVGDLVRALRAAYPFVAEIDAERMVNAYGTRAASILSGARCSEDLGQRFGVGMTEAEVKYLMAEEWARTAGDVLWRRSKLGLGATPADAAALEAWMARARLPAAVPERHAPRSRTGRPMEW